MEGSIQLPEYFRPFRFSSHHDKSKIIRANDYLIETVYTVTSTKEGDNLVRKAGFRLLEGKSIAPGRIAYEFPLNEQGIERLQQLSGRGV